MSSTNRGSERLIADNYPTPHWCVHRLLDRVRVLRPHLRMWEPCAGEGAIVDAVSLWGMKTHAAAPTWAVTELREECEAALKTKPFVTEVVVGDVLTTAVPEAVDWAITNPPFYFSFEILQHLLNSLPDSHVTLLQKLNWLGTPMRSAFFSEQPPDVYVLPNRVSFMESGKADSIEYAWFHWSPGNRNRAYGKLVMLDDTPIEERSRKKKRSK